jgi:hypothetical protein
VDYPNESDAIRDQEPWSPEKPEEQVQEEQKEHSQAVASAPVVNDILEWLDGQAAFYTSIDSIQVDTKTSANDVRVAMALAKKMQSAFQSKAAEVRTKYASQLKEPANGAS